MCRRSAGALFESLFPLLIGGAIRSGRCPVEGASGHSGRCGREPFYRESIYCIVEPYASFPGIDPA